jgi:hypothetical protein
MSLVSFARISTCSMFETIICDVVKDLVGSGNGLICRRVLEDFGLMDENLIYRKDLKVVYLLGKKYIGE